MSRMPLPPSPAESPGPGPSVDPEPLSAPYLRPTRFSFSIGRHPGRRRTEARSPNLPGVLKRQPLRLPSLTGRIIARDGSIENGKRLPSGLFTRRSGSISRVGCCVAAEFDSIRNLHSRLLPEIAGVDRGRALPMDASSGEPEQNEDARIAGAPSRSRWTCRLAVLLLLGTGAFAAFAQTAPPPPARRPRLARPPSCSTELEIRRLQRSLQERGLYSGSLSGRLDRATRDALRRYQLIVGLPQSSHPDQETCRQLTASAASTGSLTPTQGAARRVDSSLSPTTWQSLADSPGAVTRTGQAVSQTLEERVTKGTRKASEELEHTAQRSTTALIGRADSRILRDVRQLLGEDPRTAFWPASVEQGVVTLKVPRGSRRDPTPIVEAIRRIAGVKSVFLILF